MTFATIQDGRLVLRDGGKDLDSFTPDERDRFRDFCAEHQIRCFSGSSSLDFPEDYGHPGRPLWAQSQAVWDREQVDAIMRWRRQISTPFDALTKEEQKSDVEWAVKALDIATTLLERT